MVFIMTVAELMMPILPPLLPHMLSKAWVMVCQPALGKRTVRGESLTTHDFALECVQTWSQQYFITDDQIAKNF